VRCRADLDTIYRTQDFIERPPDGTGGVTIAAGPQGLMLVPPLC